MSRMRSAGRRWLLLGLLGAATLAGCRHSGEREEKAGDTRCPESRELTCLGGTNCTMDRERGCQTCQCRSQNVLEPTDYRRPEAMTPERRQ
ncbi:hypothetical protein HV824_14400 [Myxococcus sp. AM009]|uniref:hypothetical protein n=1 Tax=Myxococcus sp. AM009 TaxID=2745137 RepID=UPI00159512AA|nr:hypothetical protein [Myxococcus sp. AM009]NVI99306.1 hypothetical protein [Myxococcus sp. AM009]